MNDPLMIKGQERVVDVDDSRCQLRWPLSGVPSKEWRDQFINAFRQQTRYYQADFDVSVEGNEIAILCFKVQDRTQMAGQVEAAIALANSLSSI